MQIVETTKNALMQAGSSWILTLLFALSAASLAVIIERAFTLLRMRSRARSLREQLIAALRADDASAALELLRGTNAAAARIAARGLTEAEAGAPLEGMREAMAAETLAERRHMERGFVLLSTLGANAPFIGLFGTVVGILQAFDALGAAASSTSALAPQAVMGSIAEALVATAVGLGVAIPAVMAFNVFQRTVRTLIEDAEALSHEVLCFASRSRARTETGNGLDGTADQETSPRSSRVHESAPQSKRSRPTCNEPVTLGASQ